MFTAFQMPEVRYNENNRAVYTDADIPWNDNYTEKAKKFGWNSPSAQGNLTRDQFGYQNAQTIHGLNTGFNGIGTSMADGFNGLMDRMDYGGEFGNPSRNYAPHSENNWGKSNPFMIGSF